MSIDEAEVPNAVRVNAKKTEPGNAIIRSTSDGRTLSAFKVQLTS